uniref:sodium/potassium/calcium exchanger 2 n=1 Tax=Ciona intestinalis TaxID=7719 RepID=UPI000180BC10|nr:sodium/potassium/calcium exchanger 2 [Ciona intestinalis]|eukprot:XP_026693871.1 sodium/potassium/calcium exchanger 2 [Ciona intestinalis]
MIKQRDIVGNNGERKLRHRARSKIVATIIKIATAFAVFVTSLILLTSLLKTKFFSDVINTSRAELRHETIDLNIYRQVELLVVRKRRSSELAPSTVVAKHPDAEGTWPNDLHSGGIYSLESELILNTKNQKIAHKQPTLEDALLAPGNATVYERTKDFCEELAAKNSSHDNTTGEEGGHGGKHDTCSMERNSGVPALWTILYIFIVLFLFIALAIICDDFFVPSLEAISEKLNLSDDVAGATFMAAGSSAPELFTSIAGIGAGSDVGVGTIVGSAVFNLLVIIALTSALAGRVLQIDWRPLIRDSIFYALSIITFIMFSWDAYFVWWESFLLLLLYVLYIVTMKFNPMLMEFMASWKCCSCFELKDGRISPSAVEPVEAPAEEKNPPPPTPKPQVEPPAPTNTVIVEAEKKIKFRKSQSLDAARLGRGCGCRRCCCCCRNRRLTRLDETPQTEDQVDDGLICDECLQAQQYETRYKEVGEGVDLGGCDKEEGRDGCCRHQKKSPPPPYSENEENFSKEFEAGLSDNTVQPSRNSNQSNHNRFIFHPRSCSCGHFGTNPDFSSVDNDVDAYSEVASVGDVMSGRPQVPDEPESPDQPTSEDNPPVAGEAGLNENVGKEEETMSVFPCLPPIRHPPPDKPDSSHCVPSAKYLGNLFVYVLSFPWICAYTWTIPDCSKPDTRKWYLFSFFMSILWIASISYVMVAAVEIIGCLLGVDTYTMGLLVIAVGTSVPDALSSILVAREGYGDMAVSNAIGSNVFDINLGLGLPFLIASLITSEPVHLLSPLQTCLMSNLPLPFQMVPHVKFGFILLLILAVCLVMFIAVRFRLNRAVGVIFVSLYIGFMIYAFVQEKVCHAFFC